MLLVAKKNKAEKCQGIESMIDWTEESLQVCDWLLIKIMHSAWRGRDLIGVETQTLIYHVLYETSIILIGLALTVMLFPHDR